MENDKILFIILQYISFVVTAIQNVPPKAKQNNQSFFEHFEFATGIYPLKTIAKKPQSIHLPNHFTRFRVRMAKINWNRASHAQLTLQPKPQT